MEKGNVLVIGNSGVGKSTLINAVLGKEEAATGCGHEGTTKEIDSHKIDECPFRLIDTIGFEASFWKTRSAINEVKKWSKKSALKKDEERQINAIWFCVDGTAKKLFTETIKNLCRATRMWKDVPLIVVITKSYAVPEREENIKMVHDAFAAQKNLSMNLKKVIPVVASTYVLKEDSYVAPEGITELIEETNKILPEGVQKGKEAVDSYILKRKRALAQTVVGASTASSATVGAIPIPIADAAILTPIEIAEVNGLAYVYGISKDEKSKSFFNSIIQAGTVGVAAKAAISAIKAIPGVNLAGSVLNAIIAGAIAAALGEATIYIFEQVYLGKKTVDDIDWAEKIVNEKLSASFVEKVKDIVEKMANSADKQSAEKNITETFKTKVK